MGRRQPSTDEVVTPSGGCCQAPRTGVFVSRSIFAARCESRVSPRYFSPVPSSSTPNTPHVVFALVGDVRASSRALRQLRALDELGLTVEALTFGPAAVPGEVADRVKLSVLPRPEGRGPLFFWQAHRLFLREALERPAALYHASDLYTLPALAAAARRRDARLVLDAREL